MTSLALIVDPGSLPFTLAKAGPVFRKHVGPPVHRTLLQMGRTAKRKAPKATSQLTQSIYEQMSLDGLSGVVAPGVNYAQAAEDGTGRYGPSQTPSGKMPPVESIEDWIRVRNITPDEPWMDERDLAFVIARSIAVRGTPSQPYLKPAFETEKAAGQRRIFRGIKRGIRELES